MSETGRTCRLIYHKFYVASFYEVEILRVRLFVSSFDLYMRTYFNLLTIEEEAYVNWFYSFQLYKVLN